MNEFDRKVHGLCITMSSNICRPIEFIVKDEVEKYGHKFEVGNVKYVLGPREQIPILFMGAFRVKDWIICMEKSMISNTEVMICGFYKGKQHCNFGPIKTKDVFSEFFMFFEEKILK